MSGGAQDSQDPHSTGTLSAVHVQGLEEAEESQGGDKVGSSRLLPESVVPRIREEPERHGGRGNAWLWITAGIPRGTTDSWGRTPAAGVGPMCCGVSTHVPGLHSPDASSTSSAGAPRNVSGTNTTWAANHPHL